MMRLCVIGICVLIIFTSAGWAQPEFQSLPALTPDILPSVLYIEHREDIGKKLLMLAYPEFGYWYQQEVCRAPYIDVVYSGKGGAMLAAGDSADNCHVYGIDFVTASIKEIFSGPVKNPWAGKRQREWIRTEPISTAIYMAYDDPNSSNIVLYNFSYGTHKVEKKEIAKSLFDNIASDDLHMRIDPAGQHIAFATKPKAIPDKPGAFESTLKIIHFTNMSVTEAAKSIVTYAAGGEDKAWPAFDFQSPQYIHYFTMEPLGDGAKSQIKMIYKAVQVEESINTEMLSSIQPIPQSGGELFRHPENYYMIYDQFAPTQKRFWVDYEKSISMLVYPDSNKFSFSRDAGIGTVKSGNKVIYSAPNVATTLLGGIVSQYENRAFCIGSEDPSALGNQIWFRDPLEQLAAAAWSPNNITLVAIVETYDSRQKQK